MLEPRPRPVAAADGRDGGYAARLFQGSFGNSVRVRRQSLTGIAGLHSFHFRLRTFIIAQRLTNVQDSRGPMFPVAPLAASGPADRLVPALDRAAAQGFRAIELWFAADPGDGGQACDILAISQAAAQRGLRVAAARDDSAIAAALARDAPTDHRAALQPWVDCIAHAARLGARAWVVSAPPGERGRPERPGRAERLAQLAGALCRLRFAAEAAEVTLALELASAEWLATPAEAADFLDHVNSPCVGLRLDAREPGVHRDLADWVAVAGHRLVGVIWAGEPESGALAELLERLRRARYDGPVTLASWDGRTTDGEALRAALRRIERAGPHAAGAERA